MNQLNFSDNLTRLRREKGVTQEELATFVGVTKASVSKWETRLSMPDIMLVPALASFFDVSIDELLGYESQLSKEQIQKIYHELAEDFGKKPFEEVMERSRELVKKYYSCYPFLFQVCVLWMNHFMLAKEECQREILKSASELCDHIIANCKDVGIYNDALLLKAIFALQCGRAQETIEILEETLNPYRLANQGDGCLIQAYQMVGESEKANRFAQISMYMHLNNLVSSATQYLMLHAGQPEVCEETMRRIDSVAEAFDLEHLHPNVAANYQYMAAIVLCMQQKTEEGLERLKRYSEVLSHLLSEQNMKLHGDAFFDAVDSWFEALELGPDAPRDRKVVWDSLAQTFAHPAFAVLEGNDEYRRLKQSFL